MLVSRTEKKDSNLSKSASSDSVSPSKSDFSRITDFSLDKESGTESEIKLSRVARIRTQDRDKLSARAGRQDGGYQFQVEHDQLLPVEQSSFRLSGHSEARRSFRESGPSWGGARSRRSSRSQCRRSCTSSRSQTFFTTLKDFVWINKISIYFR